MGLDKQRRKQIFADGFTTAGSAGFNAPIDVNTTARFAAGLTLNGPPTAPTGSANNQLAGYLRINSGATTATQSTTRLNSGAILIVGAGVLVGAPVASYNLVGELVVNTIAQAASGGYFTVGFAGSNAYAAALDVPWFIINPA